jgi:fumarate reductase subunit D
MAIIVAVIGLILGFALNSVPDIDDSLTLACTPAIITSIMILIASVLVTLYGRHRLDKDKELSNTGTTIFVMLAGIAIQLALTYAFTTFVS